MPQTSPRIIARILQRPAFLYVALPMTRATRFSVYADDVATSGTAEIVASNRMAHPARTAKFDRGLWLQRTCVRFFFVARSSLSALGSRI